MKNIAAIGIIFLSLFWSCEEKFESGDFIHSDLEYTDTTVIPVLTEIGKKGIYLSQTETNWSSKVSSTRVHWHYSGSSKMSIKEPGNIDFVPMIKDTADLKKSVIDDLLKMKNNGQLRYLLGFNEPDNPDKANMTVSEAISLWPQLEQFGVPLVSPLCLKADSTWMEEFMAQAESQNLRVDYIAVQWTGSNDVTAFLNEMESIYTKYQKPIWILKFSLLNPRLSQVNPFLQAVLPELESRDYIFRYAWKSGEINTPTAFWDAESTLTARGKIYADYNSNNYLSVGRDNWLDISSMVNLAINGDFENGTLDHWAGYGTEVATGEEAYNGEYSGMAIVTGWTSGSAINYILKGLEPENIYYISFAARLTSVITKPAGYLGVRMLVRDPLDGNLRYYQADPIFSTEWQIYTHQVLLPANVTDIQLTFWRAQNSPVFMIDDLFVAKID